MKIFFYIFLFSSIFTFGQQNSENRFYKAEQENNNSRDKKPDGSKDNIISGKANPGNPGDPVDPVPIDQYLSLLFVIGLGIIVLVSKNSFKNKIEEI